jgi:2,4-dienoyl-CoA reductase-like NADH-dependent reductase (Old Yellow Enzyme family)
MLAITKILKNRGITINNCYGQIRKRRGKMKYKKLFETGKIGNLEIKNKVVFTGLGVTYAESNGEVGQYMSAYLCERAKGGTGVIVAGDVVVDSKTGCSGRNDMFLENRGQAMSFARLASMIHNYDSKIFLQLNHPGKSTNSSNLNGEQAWSSSPVKTSKGEMAKEMTIEDINYIVKCFSKSALLAKNVGVDGVEIHAAH